MNTRKLDPGSLPPRSCDLCCGMAKERMFIKYGYPMVRCSGCGLVFVDVLLTPDQLAQLYSKDFFDAEQGTRPEWSLLDYEKQREITVHNFLKKFSRIEDVIPRGGKLLDAGCAHGFFLDAIKHRYDVYGVDISEYAAEYARGKLGLANVRRGAIEDLDMPDGFFQIITMWNTLDHVSYPMEALRRANRLLEHGGILVVYTEDIGCWLSKVMGRYWFPICPPHHLTYFDRKTIRKALDKSGFEVVRQMKVGVDLPIKEVFNRLQNQGASKTIYRFYRLMENSAIFKLRVNLGSGGNMFVTARKVRPPE